MAKEYKLSYTASEINEKLTAIDNKADLVDGKVPLEQLPDNIGSGSSVDDEQFNALEQSLQELETTTQKLSNMTQKIASTSTDAQYPSAKAVYDALDGYAKTSDIPKNLSELTADASHCFVTQIEKDAWSAKSNFSGNYNDLSNKPIIPSSLPADGGNADTVDGYHIRIGTSGAVGYITFVV